MGEVVNNFPNNRSRSNLTKVETECMKCVCNFAPTVNAIMRVNILPSLRVTPPCDQFEDKRV